MGKNKSRKNKKGHIVAAESTTGAAVEVEESQPVPTSEHLWAELEKIQKEMMRTW